MNEPTPPLSREQIEKFWNDIHDAFYRRVRPRHVLLYVPERVDGPDARGYLVPNPSDYRLQR